MTQYANCGSNYRSDILAVCPQCLTTSFHNSSTDGKEINAKSNGLGSYKGQNNVVHCSKCDWGYRGDFFVTCPHCSTSNPNLNRLAEPGSSTEPSPEKANPQNKRKASRFGVTFLVALFVLIIVFGLGLMTSGFKNFAFLNNSGSNQTSASSNSGTTDTGSGDGGATTEDVGNPHGEDYGDAEDEWLPEVSTAKEAVAYSLYNYCTNLPEIASDPETWTLMSAPVSPPIEGYWDIYAVSTAGMVTMRVTPDFDTMTGFVTAADGGGEGALAEWGCPTNMKYKFWEQPN